MVPKQFKLRSLLIVIAGLAAWLATESNALWSHDRATQILSDLGFRIRVVRQPMWAAFQKPLPVALSRNITYATAPPLITDRELQRAVTQLAQVAHCVSLDLPNAQVTEASLVELTSMHELEALKLCDSTITDTDMRGIGRLACLRWIDVSGTAVTDSGIAELAGLKRLRWLRCERTRVTQGGLATLHNVIPTLNEPVCN